MTAPLDPSKRFLPVPGLFPKAIVITKHTKLGRVVGVLGRSATYEVFSANHRRNHHTRKLVVKQSVRYTTSSPLAISLTPCMSNSAQSFHPLHYASFLSLTTHILLCADHARATRKAHTSRVLGLYISPAGAPPFPPLRDGFCRGSNDPVNLMFGPSGRRPRKCSATIG